MVYILLTTGAAMKRHMPFITGLGILCRVMAENLLSAEKDPCLSLVFSASHQGSDMQAVIDGCKSGSLRATHCAGISNNSSSMALEQARCRGGGNIGDAGLHTVCAGSQSELFDWNLAGR